MKNINLKIIIKTSVFLFIAIGCNNKKDEHLKYSSDKDKTFLNKDVKTENEEVIKDFEGNKYRIVNVGNQIWTEENLNTTYFNNGEKIPEAKTNEEWKKAGEEGKPAWCYYDNDPVNGKKHGKLYNWYVLKDSRGIAPKGWHIPSLDEFKLLINEFGGLETSGLQLKSKTSWDKSAMGENGNGTNNSSFNGFPGGYRDDEGRFSSSYYATINSDGYWWSKTNFINTTSSGEPNIIIGAEGEENKFAYPISLSSGSTHCLCNSPYRMASGFSLRFVKD